jgi:hypothetical protein
MLRESNDDVVENRTKHPGEGASFLVAVLLTIS